MSLGKALPQIRNIWFLSLLMVPLLGIFSWQAATAESTAAISQGFKTNEKALTAGALVSLAPGSQSNVQLSNTERVNQLVGVVGDRPLIELNNNDKETQIVISGTKIGR